MVTENINIIITTRGARVAQTRIRGIGRTSRRASAAVLGLGAALIALGTGVAIRGLLRVSDAATEVANRIRTVTSSNEVFVSVMERVFDVSTRTGASVEDTARLYQRLSVATRDIGVGSARVLNVVEGLNAALVVSGSTAREASAALLQFGQGLASDNLSGEELRSLRENLPQFAQELAKELGFSIGALKELGRQGKLTASLVFPAAERAIVSFQEKLRNGELIFTFAQAFNVVRNSVIKAFTIIQRSTPLTQDLTKAIFNLSDGLAERLVNALADAVEFTIDLVGRFETVSTAIGDVSKVVGVLVDIFLTFWWHRLRSLKMR
jgi:tape measure domain-containing protein